ncbi:tektin-3-like [Condylostylus longicornis]|uniref:tektin-3-like n=1 Tax=Condylostylus longicornis TaxID=2530218 RepID=UPI00244DE8AA|nr:tektin-3-like [Condylostylus longicornis]
MLCWQTEDNYINKVYPFPFAPATLKRVLQQSNIPLPWHESSLPPPLQPGNPPTNVTNTVGYNYKTARAHPWRPTLAYEMCDTVPDDVNANDIIAPTFVPQGMQTNAVSYPNLVSGYQNNPQHAAKAALYTRFTPGEWVNNNLSRFSESNVNRNLSERLRSEAVRAMRETDEKTSQSQRDAGRRLGERITDTTFWRNELNTELEKLIQELAVLNECKRNVAKALQDTEAPLHITQECLYHREGRQEIEKVHDHVEKRLLLEVDNLRNCQQKLRLLYEKCCIQIQDCRAAQHSLEDDIAHKESTLGIDSVCHRLNNFSRGINYFSGIEKIDPTVSSMESWAMSSSNRINRSQTERTKSTQLRSEAETTINAVATAVWDHWCNTNSSLERRSAETAEAKSRIQLHLHKTIQEIFDMEKHIAMLKKAIEDKANPMKVAQTRLEARSHRDGIELCKDFAHMRLVQEVLEIQDSVQNLHRKLQDSESQHQQLLKTKANLELDLKRKNNALHIDREKCMGIRRSFPVNNIIKC